CKAQPGRELVPAREGAAVGRSGISVIEDTPRRVRKSLGLSAWNDPRHVAKGIFVGESRIPSQARVQGQMGCEPIIVLHIERGQRALRSGSDAETARAVRLRQSECGVTDAQARELSAENEAASALFGCAIGQDVLGIE